MDVSRPSSRWTATGGRPSRLSPTAIRIPTSDVCRCGRRRWPGGTPGWTSSRLAGSPPLAIPRLVAAALTGRTQKARGVLYLHDLATIELRAGATPSSPGRRGGPRRRRPRGVLVRAESRKDPPCRRLIRNVAAPPRDTGFDPLRALGAILAVLPCSPSSRSRPPRAARRRRGPAAISPIRSRRCSSCSVASGSRRSSSPRP